MVATNSGESVPADSDEEPKEGEKDAARRDAVYEGVRLVVGLLAAAAAVVYLAGGIVLGLRLALAGLPSLGVVGQLPREFLFSLGLTQVVAPAVVLGAAAGVLELGQSGAGITLGHFPWWRAQESRDIRRTYVGFYFAAPIVLLAPGVAVALVRDRQVEHKWLLVAILGMLGAGALLLWLRAWDRTRLRRESAYEERKRLSQLPVGDQLRSGPGTWIDPWEWLLLGTGGFVFWVPALWVLASGSGWGKYVWLTLAWAVTLLVTLLVVWLRSRIGERYRVRRHNLASLTALSWAATALLFVPGLVAFASALPLEEAVVCAVPSDGTAYSAAGRFVGETQERVYLGDDSANQIISVPADKVVRLAFGTDAAHSDLCRMDTTGPR